MFLGNKSGLAQISDTVPVSVVHKRLLDARWHTYRSGKIGRITLAELERRLANQTRKLSRND
jgi:hypothetical protein